MVLRAFSFDCFRTSVFFIHCFVLGFCVQNCHLQFVLVYIVLSCCSMTGFFLAEHNLMVNFLQPIRGWVGGGVGGGLNCFQERPFFAGIIKSVHNPSQLLFGKSFFNTQYRQCLTEGPTRHVH